MKFIQIKSANSKDCWCEGIWRSYYTSKKYWITCVHGCPNGKIQLEWNNYFYSVSPKHLRMLIFVLTGVKINKKQEIIINPCYPNAVKRRYPNIEGTHKIKIIGNWECQSGIDFSFYDDIDLENKRAILILQKIKN
jgi:hypothetical protein